MRNLHPIANAGALFRKSNSKFLGSCFIFRYVDTVLTAAHCVGDLHPDDIVVQILATPHILYQAISINKHHHADIAVLRLNGVNEVEVGWPPYSLFDDSTYGLEVTAYGFPEDCTIANSTPVARVFRGHIQRFVEWKSHMGYKYLAAELSFRCPGGLSGGKVIHPDYSGRIYALVTENMQTTNILETLEEIMDNGVVYREHYQTVIHYGIALWLPAIEPWLDEVVPPVSAEELGRRGKLQHALTAIDNKATKI